MHMSTLERRVHLLLAQEQYERVEAEAKRRHSSVGSVIREAIDLAYGHFVEAKMDAYHRIVAWGDEADRVGEPPLDPDEFKDAFEDDLLRSAP